MHSDGVAHTLTFFEDAYTEIPVTAETYEAERAKGLYYTEGALKIPDGVEEIVFTYTTPDGAFIERQNVFVLRDGLKGSPAPKYLGTAGAHPAARGDGSPLERDDTYLNTADHVLYRFDGESWAAATDYDPGWWDALGDAVRIAADTGERIEAADIWVEKLVAGTVLAQRLFAKELVLSQSGMIRSENYETGKSGFMIHGSGAAEFNDSVFRGSIYATAGVFENVEIRNCTGSVNLVVKAGDNHTLKTVADCSSTSATGSVTNVSDGIKAKGSVLVKFTVSFSGTGWYNYSRGWVRVMDDGKVAGIVSIALDEGKCYQDYYNSKIPVSNGQTLSFSCPISYNAYVEAHIENGKSGYVSITGVQVRTEDPPGIIAFI